MAQRKGPAASVTELAAFLFDTVLDDELAEELAAWMGGVPAFRAFVDVHREKVRKKLRTAAGAEGRRDVRTELLVARLLLADRRMELSFEPYGSLKGGPDFRVAMRGQPPFNLEVTRLRAVADETRLAGQVLTKLRQLPPSVANSVLIAADLERADAVDLAAVVQEIRARADAKEERFFTSRGFDSSKAFYQRFLRLGGVFLFSEAAPGDSRAGAWTNPSARIPVAPRTGRTILELLRA